MEMPLRLGVFLVLSLLQGVVAAVTVVLVSG